MTSTVISPEEIVDKIKNSHIGPASTDSSQFISAEEFDKYIASQSWDFKLLHGSHAAQFSDAKSNEEIHESQAQHNSLNNSNEEIHESHNAQSSDSK